MKWDRIDKRLGLPGAFITSGGMVFHNYAVLALGVAILCAWAVATYISIGRIMKRLKGIDAELDSKLYELDARIYDRHGRKWRG